MNTSLTRTLLAAFLALGLAACSSPIKFRDEAPVETRTPTPVQAEAPSPATAPAAESPTAKGDAPSRPDAAPKFEIATVSVNPVASSAAAAAAAAAGATNQRVVYFDFDSFALREDSRPVIESQAKALMADKSRRMLIEGHTDERGGREYNLALGQKRAEAVAKSLTLLGVSEQQLEAVSMGKEKPAAEGHDEAAWARNRRAELKDRR